MPRITICQYLRSSLLSALSLWKRAALSAAIIPITVCLFPLDNANFPVIAVSIPTPGIDNGHAFGIIAHDLASVKYFRDVIEYLAAHAISRGALH